MSIRCFYSSPPLSRTAASTHCPGGHSILFAVAVPDLTSGFPGPELHLKSEPASGHSSGDVASIHRAVERPPPERVGVCRPLRFTHIRGLETRLVLCGMQAMSNPLVSVSRTALLPSKKTGLAFDLCCEGELRASASQAECRGRGPSRIAINQPSLREERGNASIWLCHRWASCFVAMRGPIQNRSTLADDELCSDRVLGTVCELFEKGQSPEDLVGSVPLVAAQMAAERNSETVTPFFLPIYNFVPDDFMTVSDVEPQYGVSRQRVYSWLRPGFSEMAGISRDSKSMR